MGTDERRGRRGRRSRSKAKGKEAPAATPPEPEPAPTPELTVSRLLVLQPGEATARVARTCKHLGIEVVGVHAPGQLQPLHEEACDQQIEAPLDDSGVPDPGAIRDRLSELGVDAIHPGYGPPPPAWSEIESLVVGAPQAALAKVLEPAALEHKADEVCVRHVAQLDEEIERPRVIDVVVLADALGHVVPIGEAERSLQHEGLWLLTESPAPALLSRADGEAMREWLFDACMRLITGTGLTGVLTVTFLVDSETRCFLSAIQAGLCDFHCPVEMVTGLDLVELQLRLAAGAPVAPELETLQPTGHAFVARITGRPAAEGGGVPTAETPKAGSAQREMGTVVGEMRWPPTPAGKIRVDMTVATGQPILADRASLLGRICTHGAVRHQALLTLDRVLAAFHVEPLDTNVALLRDVLGHEAYRFGQLDTGFTARLGR